ncbi:hypothetical protein ACWEBX_40660 [Streptomyces sp. NPDC005070]
MFHGDAGAGDGDLQGQVTVHDAQVEPGPGSPRVLGRASGGSEASEGGGTAMVTTAV